MMHNNLVKNHIKYLLLSTILTSCLFFTAISNEQIKYKPFDIMDEVKSAAQQLLWPGFDPQSFPIAIYDGEKTYLFNHPSPPEGFEPVEQSDNVFVFIGQHESIRANTSIKISEIETATIMLNTMKERGLREIAGVVIHEAFHAFQKKKYPNWGANELELFVYPFDDVDILFLRKLETEAFRRALLSEDPVNAARWAKTALINRSERFSKMKEGTITYERGTELLEGTAQYVEYKVDDKPLDSTIKAKGYLPGETRVRLYAIGSTMALLLDRFSPEWKDRFGKEENINLDALLKESIEKQKLESFEFSRQEKEELLAKTQVEVEELLAERIKLKDEFLSHPGWQVIVEAELAPFYSFAFDPMNVKLLNNLELMHTRWLKFSNNLGSIEVFDHKALSEPMGEHPLFQGVKKVTVVGLDKEPIVEKAEGKVSINIDGLKLHFKGAEVECDGKTLIIKLPKTN